MALNNMFNGNDVHIDKWINPNYVLTPKDETEIQEYLSHEDKTDLKCRFIDLVEMHQNGDKSVKWSVMPFQKLSGLRLGDFSVRILYDRLLDEVENLCT